jgi:hypothetical protein
LASHQFARSLELGVLGSGSPVDGDAGVGVLPEGQEILIRSSGFLAGGRIGRAFEHIRASQAEARHRAPRENLLSVRPFMELGKA